MEGNKFGVTIKDAKISRHPYETIRVIKCYVENSKSTNLQIQSQHYVNERQP